MSRWLFLLVSVGLHGAAVLLPLGRESLALRREPMSVALLPVAPQVAPTLAPTPTRAPARRLRRASPAIAPVADVATVEPTETGVELEAVLVDPPVAEADLADVWPAVSESAPPYPPDLKAYGGAMFAAVMGQRHYPRIARKLGLTGEVLLRVEVDHLGQLVADPRIERSSGHELLDHEAARMVVRAAPFGPLPAGFEKAAAVIVIPVQFRLEG